MKRYRRYNNEDYMDKNVNLYEMVLNPNKYIDFIQEKMLAFYNKNEFINFEDIINSLNSYFLNEKIEFRESNKIEKFGSGLISGGFQPKTNFIYMFYDKNIINAFKVRNNNHYNEDFNNFLKHFYEFLGHEIIHRMQSIKDKTQKIGVMKDENKKKYYSQPKEIMSHAWQIFFFFRTYGFDNKFIHNVLKDRKDPENLKMINYIPVFKEYYNLFDKNSNVIKLLYKYIYLSSAP